MKNDFFKNKIENSETIQVLSGYGLKVLLDKRQVFIEDPGQGTPAMVYKLNKYNEITHSATYWCASDTGELDGCRTGVIDLSDKQIGWLHNLEEKVVSFLYG